MPSARGALWVNPDCGLKTRRYEETTGALAHTVAAERTVRTVRAERTGTAWASSLERPGS
jgi:hypothetical protein